MSHRLQNTSVFNSSNEIKKINNRGALDRALCNDSERFENTIFAKLFILDVCGVLTTPQDNKVTHK